MSYLHQLYRAHWPALIGGAAAAFTLPAVYYGFVGIFHLAYLFGWFAGAGAA